MILGLYKHYRGHWYLGLFRTRESDNDATRVWRVVYFSLGKLQLDDRTESEFLGDEFVKSNEAVDLVLGHYPRGLMKVEVDGRVRLRRFGRVLPWWQPKAKRRSA